MQQTEATLTANEISLKLRQQASSHPCWSHELFGMLSTIQLTSKQAGRLLRNYDAHACVLRRLLLQAAALMPEPAVGFVLENVRNEYGNGDYLQNHQWQLQDVARQANVRKSEYEGYPIEEGVREFCKRAPIFYLAREESALLPKEKTGPFVGEFDKPTNLRAAISAGAITATEILAIREFEYLQMAFAKLGLADHVWFDHVTIEAEHSDESLALALYFAEKQDALHSVEAGFRGILAANMRLYDGLLATIC